MRPSSASAGVSNGFFEAGAADRGRSSPAGTSWAHTAAANASTRQPIRPDANSRLMSEDELQRELILPGVESRVRRGNLAETAGAENRRRPGRTRVETRQR